MESPDKSNDKVKKEEIKIFLCPVCDGSGYTKDGKCEICNGKGEIKKIKNI